MKILRSTLLLVRYAVKQSQNTVSYQASCSPCLSHLNLGILYVCLDFIEGLPKFRQFNTILAVIDKFPNLVTLFLCLILTQQSYLNNIYKLHGMPKVLVSDRDRVFTSALWKELFKLSDTVLNMSSAYHPQTDGQTERLNQCLETYLRCFVQVCLTKWSH